MDKLEIVSVNVRGLNTYEKRVKIYDWLTAIKVDIALLQETHYVEKKRSKIQFQVVWKIIPLLL